MDLDKTLHSLEAENPFVRDKAINQIAKDFFSMEHPQEVKDLILYGILSLLLDKNIITQEEITRSVEESTAFYKILKTRQEKDLTKTE